MRRTHPLLFKHVSPLRENLVQIRNGTFYRQHPSAHQEQSSSVNPPLFSNLTFELPATQPQQHWAVLGASGVTTLLEILQGNTSVSRLQRGRSLTCPPTRSRRRTTNYDHPPGRYSMSGSMAAKTMDKIAASGAYLSARYESHREETDWSVLQYLKGETDLNPAEEQEGIDTKDAALLSRVIRDLRMEKLVSMPVSNLSNGQNRRARIARALLGKPELLLLDEPFMGLDPPTLVTLSPILRDLAYSASPRLLLALRPQDPIPDWITHLMIIGTNHTVALLGEKAEVLFRLHRWADFHGPSDADSRNLAVAMAYAMDKRYGPPLHEVGHTLTSKGIVPNKTYAAAKVANDPAVFRKLGNMNPEVLDADSKLRLKRAISTIRKGQRLWPAVLTLRNLKSLPLTALLDATALVPSLMKSTGHNSRTYPEDVPTRSGVIPTSTTELLAATSVLQPRELGKPLIELSSVVIKYGDKTVLGYPPPQPGYTEPGLNLTIRQGTRLALLGPNGSGKTTLLSLLTSDHPHSYSLPIKFFGRSRLPSVGTVGLSLFEIQSHIGHSSPEIHAFFPKNLSIRQTLESAWAETFSSRPKLTYRADEMVDVFLKWWEPELNANRSSPSPPSTTEDVQPTAKTYVPDGYQSQRLCRQRAMFRLMEEEMIPSPIYPEQPWFPSPSQAGDEINSPQAPTNIDWAETIRFGDLSFGMQRLLLLLRAMVKQSDILVLDEAFSGLCPDVRDKAMLWLEYGQTSFKTRNQVAKKTGDYCDSQVVQNQRHVFDAMCARLDLSEDKLMETWLMTGPVLPALREIRGIKDDEELKATVEGWEMDVKKSYRFMGLEVTQAMVVVSHIKEEVPGMVDQWIRLPSEEEIVEAGRSVEMGDCLNGEIRTVEGWNRVWGLR